MTEGQWGLLTETKSYTKLMDTAVCQWMSRPNKLTEEWESIYYQILVTRHDTHIGVNKIWNEWMAVWMAWVTWWIVVQCIIETCRRQMSDQHTAVLARQNILMCHQQWVGASLNWSKLLQNNNIIHQQMQDLTNIILKILFTKLLFHDSLPINNPPHFQDYWQTKYFMVIMYFYELLILKARTHKPLWAE